MTGTNAAFRDHVTSTGFALTLGKTHITALVLLDLELAAELVIPYSEVRSISRAHQLDVSARAGLIARGLVADVTHLHEEKYRVTEEYKARTPACLYAIGAVDYMAMPVGEKWNITRAGRLVVELLQEAGVYQEYAGPLYPVVQRLREEKSSRAGRRAA